MYAHACCQYTRSKMHDDLQIVFRYFSYRNMTERERTDFLSGDKNNDHFYKRSQTTSPVEATPAKKPTGSLPHLSYKTGKRNQ